MARRRADGKPRTHMLFRERKAFASVLICLLLVVGSSVAFAEEDPGGSGGPSLSQVQEAIADPDLEAVPIPQVDSQAAEELPNEDLNRAEVNELLAEVFGQAIEGPAGIFDELEVEKFYSDNVALIAPGDQPNGEGVPDGSRPTLLEASLPLRTETSEGDQRPVDLGLEYFEGEIRPANPLVEVEIPTRLENGIALPDTGVRIELDGAPADRSPSNLNESVATYPNVADDTSLVVAPTPTGVETFTLLQSPDAPLSQKFNLTLPSGGTLRETDDGGAEVSRGDDVLVAVRPPSAIDAEESSVPVRLETAGDSIVITVEPSADNQYPILVDPMWETYYWFQRWTTSFAGWSSFSNSPVFTTSHNGVHEGIWDPGLQIGSGNTGITPGAQARWDYRVPRWSTDVNGLGQPVKPTSFINRVIFSQLFFDVQAYANNPLWNDPFFAFYLWDENKGEFVAIGHRFGLQGNLSNMNYEYNLYNTSPPNENVNAKQTSLELVSSQTKSQYRQLYVGLAGVELSDKDFPVVSPLMEPDGWFTGTAVPIEFTATDTGLGLRQLSLTQPRASGGSKITNLVHPSLCTGGAMSPCPRYWKSSAGPAVKFEPSVMPQGENAVTLKATDALGQVSTNKPGLPPGTGSIWVNVDHTAPSLALSGSLTEQGAIGTSASQYTLKYKATDGDHDPPSALASVGIAGSGSGQMQRPRGVAFDASGNMWVADTQNNRIQKYSANGSFLMQFGSAGMGAGQFNKPIGLAVGSNGWIWVADSVNKRVQVFDSQGTFINSITYGPFVEPVGVATGPNGALWIADRGARQVFKFTQAGTFVSTVKTSLGGTYNNFSAPIGLATDAGGNVWVADNGHNKLIKFNAEGKIAFEFGSEGTGNGQFRGVVAVAVARSGNLVVTDDLNNRVQVFQPSGDFLRQFGSLGSGSGQLKEPREVAINPDGTVLVADAANSRLARWSHADYDPQSGAAATEVKVDGQLVEKFSPGCATRSCAIDRTWTLKSADYAAGQHQLDVIATDGVGLSTTKSLTFTTIKDTTAPQLSEFGSIFTAPEGWMDQGPQAFWAGALDGGYGVASLVLKIDGQVVRSTTQNCTAGGCGAWIIGSIDLATYKGGAHAAELIATDIGGNVNKKVWTINVNPQGDVSGDEAVDTIDASDATSDSGVVASTDEVVHPAEQAAGNEPGLQQDGDVFESTGTGNQSTIAVDPADGFTVESPDGLLEVVPVGTSEDATPMVVEEEAAATSANTSANVDTVIRPVFYGVFDYQSIRDKAAPEKYSWEVKMSGNQVLNLVNDQYAEVKHAVKGTVAYGIVADPAHDSIGTTLQTSLDVSGNILTLTVPHRSKQYVYPVVGGVGWEGGFTTSLAVMPPPETPLDLAALEVNTVTSSLEVGPPEPVPANEADASTSALGELRKSFARTICGPNLDGVKEPLKAFIILEGDCGNAFTADVGEWKLWDATMRGAFLYVPGVRVRHKEAKACTQRVISESSFHDRAIKEAYECRFGPKTSDNNGGASAPLGHYLRAQAHWELGHRGICGDNCGGTANPWHWEDKPQELHLWPSGMIDRTVPSD